MAKAKQPASVLRGEAAWQAAKADMAKRNNEARDRAQAEGAAKADRAAAHRRYLDRLSMSDLPEQPGRSD